MLIRAVSGSSGGGSGTPVLLWENTRPNNTFTASYPLADIQSHAVSDNWGQYDALLVHSKNFYSDDSGQSITVVLKGASGNWANKVFGDSYNTNFKFNSDGTITATYNAGYGNVPPLKIYGINLGLTP